MQSLASALLHNDLVVVCVLASIVVSIATVPKLYRNYKLNAIPTVGPSSWRQLWQNRHKLRADFFGIMQEGYVKYKSAPFKIFVGQLWMVILGSHVHMEELRRAPEHIFSLTEAQDSDLRYTLGPGFTDNQHHLDIIVSQLTRSIAASYHCMRDEVAAAFEDVLELKSSEWKSVTALASIQTVVCRASNRSFVGLPLCRNPAWVDLNMRFIEDVRNATRILKCFPGFFAPLVARFLTTVIEGRKQGRKLLSPIIKERLKLLKKIGKDWDEKPNDMLSWLLDLTPDSVELLTTRILFINLSAVNATSNSFTHMLFFLAGYPEYIQPLREEVESIIQKQGWSKASLGKMRKVDSFVKECQRLAGVSPLALFRRAVNDYTFSDGTFIPKGTLVAAASGCLHLSNEYYHNARVFDPFRFSNMREEDGEFTKHHFVTTSLEYMPFGHGKHACPGRFFVANLLKTMLAHIVLMYDVKLEDDKVRPELKMGSGATPDPTVKVMFRKRIFTDARKDEAST